MVSKWPSCQYVYDVPGNFKNLTLSDNTDIGYITDGQNRRIGKKANGTLVHYQNQIAFSCYRK